VPGPRARFADDQLAQLELGRVEVRLRAARLLLIDAAERCCALGATGAVPRADVALVGLACAEATAAAVRAVDVACQLTGSAAVRAGAPLERRRRDIDTLRKHQLFRPSNEVPLGRQIAGIPTVAYPFLTHPIGGQE
jgi:alkylation response protein AidB-like acyl-CoA dehydrogenase